MKKSTIHSALIAAFALGIASTSFADQGITVKFGAVDINPNSTATPMVGPYTPTDALSLQVESKTTVYFGASYNFTDHWQADLVMGVPPKHQVNVVVLNPAKVTPEMAAANGQPSAYVTQFAPTAFMNYVFGSKEDSFRPFLGLGANYTKFTKAESTPGNDALNGGPTTLGLTSSKGLAAQAGFSQKFAKDWAFFASVSTAKVHTTLTSDTVGIDRTSEIKFKPAAITIAVGYSF